MRGPEPHRQRQLRPVQHRPGRYRRLATAVEAFVSVRPALQQRGACAATGGADKPLRPTPLQQERRATRLVGKARLKLAQRSRPSHACPLPPDADRRRTAPPYYILTNLGQRDEPPHDLTACKHYGEPYCENFSDNLSAEAEIEIITSVNAQLGSETSDLKISVEHVGQYQENSGC